MKTPGWFNSYCLVLFLALCFIGYSYLEANSHRIRVVIKDKTIWTEPNDPPLQVYDPSYQIKNHETSMPIDDTQEVEDTSQYQTIKPPKKYVTDQDSLNHQNEEVIDERIPFELPEYIPLPELPDDIIPPKTEYNGIVNINTDTLSSLCSLDGIGEVIAQRIIDFREANGGFGSIEDIMLVNGIGEAKFNRIKNRITI